MRISMLTVKIPHTQQLIFLFDFDILLIKYFSDSRLSGKLRKMVHWLMILIVCNNICILINESMEEELWNDYPSRQIWISEITFMGPL